MSKVVVSQFVSLDGVFEDPGGSEGTPLGAWSFEFDRGGDGNKFKLDEVMASDALLLGRITYEGFAEAWPSRTDEFADKFNGMRKYLVSTTTDEPTWNNTTLIKDDVAAAVEAATAEHEGDILVNGSATLIRTLMENDLIDEYRLMVFPVVLGQGKRLFQDGGPTSTLSLTDATPVGPDGVIILTYEPVRSES